MSQNVVLGIEQRYFKSDVGFLAAPALTSAVGSQPLSLRYLAKVEQVESAYGGYVEYVTNTKGGRGNDPISYNAARAGAQDNWQALRYGADVRVAPGSWTFVGRARGQYARDALIPGEQLGLGGFASVRGFRERETAGDEGYFVNLEAYAPMWTTGIAPFGFYDFGWRRLVKPVPGMPSTDNVASAGIGARWNWQKRLDVTATVASVLNGVSLGTAPASSAGDWKAYLTVFYRF
jgi:hemolysin activation/secretion protein